MTHVVHQTNEGGDWIRSKVFDRRSATEAPSTAGVSGQSAIQFKDEGSNIGTSGAVTAVDFTGAGVTASHSAGTVTVTIGGGSVSAGQQVNYAYTESATTASDTGGTAIPRDNTIPQNTEGVAYASLDTTITPTASSSFLDVELCIPAISSSTAQTMAFAIFRDSTADAIATAVVTVPSSDYMHTLCLRIKVAAGSTSATTFKVRWAAQTSTGYLLRNNAVSDYFGGMLKATMTVREIAQ